MKNRKKKDGMYVGARLPPDLYDAIEKMARSRMRSVAAEIRLAIQNHVQGVAVR